MGEGREEQRQVRERMSGSREVADDERLGKRRVPDGVRNALSQC